VKIAPLWHALHQTDWCEPVIVHTGQHHDINMSDWFFRDLSLPRPDHHLSAQTGSHARVTGSTMINFEALCQETPPDLTVVVGDVDSTVACTLAAKKLGIPVAHLEAGLRSGDRSMPEELNRVVTDSISDFLWTPSRDGNANLEREGIDPHKINFVGNIMIDSLVMVEEKIKQTDLGPVLGADLPDDYAVITLHRPSNVDAAERLEAVVDALGTLAADRKLVFPVHPRTRKNLDRFGLRDALAQHDILIREPMGYIEFLSLVRNARFLFTDSGGIQEETTFLGIPCLTLRENTERPITITEGTNRLTSLETLEDDLQAALKTERSRPTIQYWDGRTASRVADAIMRSFV